MLDIARYQHNAAVKALASQLGITLLFLPSYWPNLYLIERLYKFTKHRALYCRYLPSSLTFLPPSKKSLTAFRARTPSSWRR